MKVKRIISVLITMCLIFGTLSAAGTAFAAGDEAFETLSIVLPYGQSSGDYADPNGTGLIFRYESSSRWERSLTYERTRGNKKCRATLMCCREGSNLHTCDYYNWDCTSRLASKMIYKVDNSKLSADQREVVIEFDYYDDPEFFSNSAYTNYRSIEFKYLAYNGGSTPKINTVRIPTEGTGTWKTANFTLTDAQFNHATVSNSSSEGFQNGYDICIGMGGNRGGFATTYLTIAPPEVTQSHEYTLSNLTAYGFSGQKYVTDSFTPVIPELTGGDSFQITSSDASAVAYDSSTNTVVVTRDSSVDKIVTVTLRVTKEGGSVITKVFELYVPSASIDCFYEGFDYPSLKNKSISGADSWSFSNENNDTSSTGSTNYIKASPDDESDLVMDTQVYRTYSTNQYPMLSCNAAVMGDAVVQTNIKFGDSAKNTYVWYVWGYVKTASGETEKHLLEFYFKRGDGTFNCTANGKDIVISTTAFPTNQWINIKAVIHATDNNFDIYQDNVKLNTSPISLRDVTEGGTVTKIGAMSFGVSRWTGNAGHMYLDDILIRYSPAAILETEAAQLNLPSTLVYDYNLPTTGIYDGTTISWTSSNERVLSSTGHVTRNIGFGSTVVTLTATIAYGGETYNKNIDVKVVNTPYYTIDSLVFETSGGETAYSAVSGGKIKSMFVTKYTAEANDNATAYVTVYDANGKLIAASTPVNVTATGELTINMRLPDVEGMYAKAFIWNSSTLEPLAYSYSTKIASGAAVYTIGDSTMQSYGTIEARRADNRMTGWAQVLPLAVKNSSVTLENKAVAGTSTLSFYNLGYIHPVYDSIKPGDYLVIQFGHNDEKPWMSQDAAKNYSPLEPIHQLHPKATEVPEWAQSRKTYEQWLREYAAAARMKGAQVVFATSIYRHLFEENGDAAYSHYGYPEAMIDTAAETGAPVLDLCSRTGEWLQALGQSDSLKYYVAFHGGDDHTHLTYDGAVEVANMALNEMRRIGHPLKDAFTSVPLR